MADDDGYEVPDGPSIATSSLPPDSPTNIPHVYSNPSDFDAEDHEYEYIPAGGDPSAEGGVGVLGGESGRTRYRPLPERMETSYEPLQRAANQKQWSRASSSAGPGVTGCKARLYKHRLALALALIAAVLIAVVGYVIYREAVLPALTMTSSTDHVTEATTTIGGELTTEAENKLESVHVIFGLYTWRVQFQDVYQISLERSDSVLKVGRTPANIDYGAAACVLGDTLYAVGIGSEHKKLWKWNAASDWTRCADMTSYRRDHCAAVVDSTLYALGGRADDYGTTLSSVEAYNSQTDEWSAAGLLTHAAKSATCASYNNSIYVFGGEDANGKVVAHVQVYDAAQYNCTLLHNQMPRADAGMKAVVWETYAILLGRETCFIYNFETETWLERLSFKTGVYGFSLVVDNQTLYIAGGGWDPYTAEVQRVSVRDVIEDKRGAHWTHHATLPQPGYTFVFSPVPLYRASSPPGG